MAGTDTTTTQNQQHLPLRITDTTLRDAHQSLWATRLKTDDIMGIIDTIDAAGYYSLEVWGGATFDVCLRFLRENPWERLRQIKSRAKNTPLQMLLRGQNVVGYKNYADDLLNRFVELAIYNGIDIFRIFDALNDSRNLAAAIAAVKRHGGHAQGTISFTISPYHTTETYVRSAREQVDLGIDTLCIKDMAGILSPMYAAELIGALTEEVEVPIQLHCHSSSGMAVATYVEAVRAGAGAIDCAISPMAGYSSQPPVETMAAIFDSTDYSTNLDIGALREIARYFENLSKKMKPSYGQVSIIDPDILIHQIPGGMISNLRSQLAQQKALDRLPEVLEEIPRVRADMGYPPLVTPTSQIVGTQSVLNVLSGERYKIIPIEVKNYVKGLYGRPPQKLSPDFIKLILGDEQPIDHRPADDLEAMLPHAAEDLDSTLIEHEEDIISYCLFPEQALEFFKWRRMPPEERPPAPIDLEIAEREETKKTEEKAAGPQAAITPKQVLSEEPLLVREDYLGVRAIMEKMAELNVNELMIRKGDASISLKSDESQESSFSQAETAAQPAVEQQQSARQVTEQAEKAAHDGPTIDSPLVGQFYRSPAPGKPPFVKEGDSVKAGDTVGIVEAMKLINEINAANDCTIVGLLVEDGQSVDKGQPLFAVREA